MPEVEQAGDGDLLYSGDGRGEEEDSEEKRDESERSLKVKGDRGGDGSVEFEGKEQCESDGDSTPEEEGRGVEGL